jgi:hypothetical protein
VRSISLSLYKRRPGRPSNSQSHNLSELQKNHRNPSPSPFPFSVAAKFINYLSRSICCNELYHFCQMSVIFKPPPPPAVPLLSKPSVFRHYTGPSNLRTNRQREIDTSMFACYLWGPLRRQTVIENEAYQLSAGESVHTGSHNSLKGCMARNDSAEPGSGIDLSSSLNSNYVDGGGEGIPQSQSSNKPPPICA